MNMKAITGKKSQVMMALRTSEAKAFNDYYDRLEEPKPSKTALLSHMVMKYINDKEKDL